MPCNDSVVGTITVGTQPLGLENVSGGTKVYVANNSSSGVTIIDSVTSGTTTVNVPGNPREIAWGNNKAFVTLVTQGQVVTIDTNTQTTGTTISVGPQPFGITYDDINDQVYVSNSGTNNVSVIDATTDLVTSTITVGSNPYGIDWNPVNNRVYVANQNSGDVSVIDTSTNTVVNTITGFTIPYGVAVNNVDNTIYVTDYTGGTTTLVRVIDGITETIIATIPAGNFALSLGYNSDDNRVYVANNTGNNVTIIDCNTNTVCNTITVGNGPFDVIYNPFDNYTYITNAFSGTVTLLEVVPDVTPTQTPTPTSTPTLTPTIAQNAVEVVSCCRSENLTVLVLGNYFLGQTILIGGECYEILGPYVGPVGPTVYTINADTCAECLASNPCPTPTPTPTPTLTNTPTPYFYYIQNCCDESDKWRVTSLTDLGWNIGEFYSLKLVSPGGPNPNDGCYTVISEPDLFSSYTWDQTEVINNYGSCDECFATEITLTVCPTPTPTITPTVSQTATQTVTPTQTTTETPTSTPTPTQTPTQTQTSTPTLTPTISQTSTPTATPTLTATDEPFDIYSFVSCCDPSNKFRYNNVIGILSVGQVFHISGGTGFEGCAEVIPYEVTGPIYVGSEVNFIEQGNCEGDLCEECPTPTPTPTLQSCECISYVITNLFDIPDFVYFTNCFGDNESVEVEANSEISICACEGTVFSGDGIGIVQDGFCPPLTQTPQPTLTQQSTPTPTPTIGWNLCDQDFCFVTYEPSLDLYNGTYVVGGTYGDRYFYSGDVEGVVYYNVSNSQWCLSDSVGGECLLGGPSPSLSPCPDLWSEIFVEGTCNTTTTTTSDCETFDFVAYFDCDTSETQTPTPTPTLTPTQTLTPTPSLDICSSVSANIVISAYTTTTTTIPVTTTTTTICYETVTGTTSYEVLNEIFVCPGLTYEFVGCENGTLYYVEPSSLFNNINLVNGTVVSFNSGSETICATFNGTTTVSPNLSIQGPVFDYEGCLLCLIQPTLTPTPTFTPTNTPSNTPSNTPTLTATPTSTSGPTPTPTVTVSQTQTVTPTQTATPTPTLTPTITLTPTTSNNPYPFTLVGKCYDGRFYAEGGSAFSNCTQVQNGLGSSTRYKSNYPTNYLYTGQWQFVNMIIYDSVTMTVLNSLPLSDGCHFWETSSNGKVLAGYPQLGYDCTNQDICCVGFEPE